MGGRSLARAWHGRCFARMPMGRWIWLIGLGLACGPSGRITGKVVVSKGDPTLATVTATGRSTAVAAVAGDGSYALDGLDEGTWRLEASSPWTLEGGAATRVEVGGGSVAADPLWLTASGEVAGLVTAPVDVTGAEVFVASGSARQGVGPDGTFSLQVEAGDQTVVAALSGYRPAQAQLWVRQGAVARDVTLALAAPAWGDGSLAGRAYYFDRASHAGIRVEVEGTGLSTTTAGDGSYALEGLPNVPLSLRFSAPGYAPRGVAGALPGVGAPARVRDVRLSLAQSLFQGRVHGDSVWVAPDGASALFAGSPETDPATPWLYALALGADAGAAPLLRLTGPSALDVAWQDDGALAAVSPSSFEPGRLWAVDARTLGVTELTQARYRGSGDVLRVVQSRVFFLEATGAGPSLAVYDARAGSTARLGPVSLPAQWAQCAGPAWSPGSWPEAGALVKVAADGRAAYLTAAPDGGVGSLTLFAAGTVSAVPGAAPDCLGDRGGGWVGASLSGGVWTLAALGPAGGQALLQGPAASFLGGFTGDQGSAWAILPFGEESRLVRAPTSGGAAVPLYASPLAFQVIPQPGGTLFAVSNVGWDHSVALLSPAGLGLGTFAPRASAGASAGVFFSPAGRWLGLAFEPDASLTLLDTGTRVVQALAGQPLSLDPAALASEQFRFAPGESSFAYLALGASGCEATLVWPGGALGSGGACPALGDWVDFSPDGQRALVRGATARLVSLSTGMVLDLGQPAWPLDGTPAFFSGDASRLGYRDAAFRPARVFAVDVATGVSRYAADDDGALFVPIPKRAAWLVVEDPALAPEWTPPSSAPGLYFLSP